MKGENLKGLKKIIAENRAKRETKESQKQNLRRVSSGIIGNEGTYLRNSSTVNNNDMGNSAMRMRPRDKR